MARQDKIVFELDAKNQKLQKQLDQANSKLDQTKKKTTGLKDVFKKVFGALGIASFIATAVIALKNFIGVLSDFDKGMRNVNSLLGLSEQQFRSYSNEVLQVQKELGINSKELTDALYQIVSAGVSAGDSIAFLKEAAKVGIAGVGSTTEAVDILTTVLNAFHLEASKASHVSDVLFQTIKLGKTTLPELAQNFSVVSQLANSSGVSFEQVSAAIATLTKQGVPTTKAVTQINRSLIGLNEVLGDGWAKTMTYQEAVKEVAKQAGGSNNKLKEMLGRVEGVNAVLGLTGKNAKQAASDLDAMNNSIGTANKAFEENSKSIEIRWNKFTGRIIAGATKVADSILDMVLPIEKTQTAMQQLSEEMAKSKGEFDRLTTTYRILRQQTNLTEGETKLYKETISKLNELYPNYLKNVNLEKDSLENVETAFYKAGIALDKYIQKQITAAVIQEKTAKLAEIGKNIIELQIKRIEFLAKAETDTAAKAVKQGTINVFNEAENQLKIQKEKLTTEISTAKKVLEDLFGDILNPKPPGGKKGGLGDNIDSQSKIAVKAINDIQIAIKELEKVSNISVNETVDRFSEFADKAKEVEEKYFALSTAAEEFGRNAPRGLKEGFKAALDVILSYLEKLVLAAEVGTGLQALLGNPFNLVKLAGIVTLFESLKAEVASFRSGVDQYEGGLAKVHKDELVTNLPKGSSVFTKTETANLLDMKPLIREIQLLRKDVQVLQNPQEVIKGETVYKMYQKQNNKRLSTN